MSGSSRAEPRGRGASPQGHSRPRTRNRPPQLRGPQGQNGGAGYAHAGDSPGAAQHCRRAGTRILEWGAISFSRGSSQPRDGTWVCRTADRPALYLLSHREARCLHFACVKRSDDSVAPSLRPPRHRCGLAGRPQPRRPPVCTSLCPAVTFSAAGACSVWCLTCVLL